MSLDRFRARLEAAQRERAVAPVQRETATYAEALALLYAGKYTGVVLFHFHEGRATSMQVPNPVSVQLI